MIVTVIRRLLAKFGPLGVLAEDHTALQHCTILGDVKVGYRSYANLTTLRNVNIGRFCSIGRGCSIGAAKHRLDFVSTHPSICGAGEGPHSEIGHDVWIGDNVTILSGVRVGTRAVVGAGAVVTKNVPPYAVVGGIPAKLIRMRFDDATIEKLLRSRWWEYGDPVNADISEALEGLSARLPEHHQPR